MAPHPIAFLVLVRLLQVLLVHEHGGHYDQQQNTLDTLNNNKEHCYYNKRENKLAFRAHFCLAVGHCPEIPKSTTAIKKGRISYFLKLNIYTPTLSVFGYPEFAFKNALGE
jgi:hypothetical protein